MFSFFIFFGREEIVNFHKDELVWRDDKHQHDQGMTWLTAIESEDEFERVVMLVRYARAFGGNEKVSLKNWETRNIRIRLQEPIVLVMFFLLTLLDRFISLAKTVGYFPERSLFGGKYGTPKN